MKVFVLLFCFLPAALCWRFPGYEGFDCPTVARKMMDDPDNQWMIPKCQKDGTFQDLQCYDQYPDVPDTCMCTAADGTTITLPGFGLNIKSCVCVMAGYLAYVDDPEAEEPKCENGYFAPLQCSEKNKTCWCVDRNGNILVPPSPDVHSCDNVAY